jgi:2-polyprenyl-3-methyl-5-hydroxy-6-metoxy-1,4-benzoquinol methylase
VTSKSPGEPDRYNGDQLTSRWANGGKGVQSEKPEERRVLVFFPTYNESGNVERLVHTIWEFCPTAQILVVDDASPDGTGAILDRLAAEFPKLGVIHRPGKLGLGSAHQLAMLYARDSGFDILVTMDADFSHHPRYLPQFLERLGSTADFVTGSRYMNGGKSDYGVGRTFISRTANLFAKLALGLPIEEHTTMYRGFTGELLRRMNVEAIKSEGYSFAVECLHHVSRVTNRLAEFPIHFENRATGASKISEAEIYKAVVTIQRIGMRRLFRRPAATPETSIEKVPCCSCGGRHHVEVYPSRDERRGNLAHDVAPYSCATHSTRTHGQILRCLECGLIFMRPKLSMTELVGEYADAVDPVYLEHIRARETTFRYNLGQVRRHIRPSDRILEIGSYCGAFLKVAREEGLDIVGVEPSAWAAEVSKDVSDAKVFCGTVDELPTEQRSFDVVVAWDVLEHFGDPVEELRKINALLSERGTLLFSTLMIDNWFPKMLGKHWPWLMDMHLFYFTESTIRNVLAETGFEIVEDGTYCHVVTAEYLMSKLGTLGVPLASALSKGLGRLDAGRTEIPFRFGDIKLFVCRKTSEAPARSVRRPSGYAASDDAPGTLRLPGDDALVRGL